ncbi:Anaphase-promoting complex subunit 5 [Rhynchospora pubera]|uniref:Anaphase-promoting complex subunit 5 n=1 Tax=Rhynchospora pubera TaxID=906938 RepID=A0AAV8GF53_9POAL|nr:Anaphase-promoting complex subunit 5 [Rhynchospora pubera]
MSLFSLGGGLGSRELGGGGGGVVFDLTPHKIALCQLIHVFAPPAHHILPFPFESVSHHNRLGLLLFSLTRSCEDYLEPPLEDLLNQLKAINNLTYNWFRDHLITDLSSLTSADDLFNFFDKIQSVLVAPDSVNMDGDQIFLDPSSHLGIFLRCCILAFNSLSFEGICHLLTKIGIYCNAISAYELAEEEEFNPDPVLLQTCMQMEEMQRELTDEEVMEAPMFARYTNSFGPETPTGGSSSSSFRIHSSAFNYHGGNNLREEHNLDILRSRWQIEGYLNEQANLLEKNSSSVPLNSLNGVLSHIQKLAPNLHRVKYLQYLNALSHDDFASAADSLHRYFDYSAGKDGLFNRMSPQVPQSVIILGRYEAALLCLGTLHSRFGHSKTALDALTEAVCFSQRNNDDACLTYTLAAICNLFFETGTSRHSIGIIESPHSVGTSTGMGTPSSTQQLLLVLLKRSLKRADSLKLTSLSAHNRLTLAKFDLKHVKRPLVSFGPKASTNLKTCPIDVCRELRLSGRVLTDFGSDNISLLNDSGTFSTSWLKNLATVNNKNMWSIHRNDYDVFNWYIQPSPIPASVLQLAGSSYLLRSTSWEHYGSAPLVRVNALVYATCFADVASSSESSLAYVKLIQHLAVFKGHSEAFSALKLAEEKSSSTSKFQIRLLRLQMLHDRALHRGHLKLAQKLCDDLGDLASSGNGVDMDFKTEASLRQARTLLSSNQFGQAEAVASNLFCSCYKYNMQVENATVLLLLAEIHKKSGNVMLGLPYALASLSFCKAFNLDLLEACATLTIAEIWLALGPGHAKRASYLVHKSLPMILGHGGLELCARANIALAKCYLSDPTFSIITDPSCVLDPLSQAAEELQILEYHEMAAEAFYLIAMVYNHLGMVDEREEAAASFKNHLLSLENANQAEDEELLFY